MYTTWFTEEIHWAKRTPVIDQKPNLTLVLNSKRFTPIQNRSLDELHLKFE